MFRAILTSLGLLLFPFRPEYFPELESELRYTLSFLLNMAYDGVLAILAFHITTDWKRAALSILTAVALFAAGSLVGFILALPRLSTDTGAQTSSSATAPADSTSRRVSPIGFNNNLVDISDWITKSVLALSIANYRDLIPALKSAARYLALDDSAPARAEAMVIIIGYTSIGVLYAYITTRTVVTSLLVHSATALNPEVTKSLDAAGRVAIRDLDPTQQGDEPRRQTDTISSAEKNTATAIASQTAGVPIGTIKAQLEQLSRTYADVRTNQKPGPERTVAMEEIAGKMRALSVAAAPLLTELKSADPAGLRLAAIAILEMKPDPAEAEWLTERLATESPFVGYHAALALRESAAIVSCADKQAFLRAIEKARASVPQVSDRAKVIADATNKLAQRCPD
ncbi:MAG: hypothetical protein JO336_00730 [Acidobacteriia bacterium]|nr:hypothetical protein [Terriglobia bacterium]MBV8905807.1 hypothetical protein [Terriglobia bacterium]